MIAVHNVPTPNPMAAPAYAVGVVEEFDRQVGVLYFLHLLQLPSVPGKAVSVEGGGVADGVVGIYKVSRCFRKSRTVICQSHLRLKPHTKIHLVKALRKYHPNILCK